jgi:putative transcriptional regulator
MPVPKSRPDVCAIRIRLGLTQLAFARRYGLSVRTVQGWERGGPTGAAGRVLLTLIDRQPATVAEALTRR